MKIIITETQLKKVVKRISEGVTDRHLTDENDDDSSEMIEGSIEYDGHLINYKVEYHEDFGYSYHDISSDDVDEEYIDDHYDDITDKIEDDIRHKPDSISIPENEYVVIDTRTGKVLGRSKTQIDRGFASEYFDLPKKFIDIQVR